MCESPSVLLRTRPPVDQQGEQVGRPDGAALVEVPRAWGVAGEQQLESDELVRAQRVAVVDNTEQRFVAANK